MSEPFDHSDPSGKSEPTAEPELFGGPSQGEPRNWIPWVAGFAVVLVGLVLLAVLSRSGQQRAAEADPYAPMLAVEQMRLSQAENFAGATITYIDLTVQNNGQRTVVGGVARAVFRDTLGQVVQTETLPLRALLRHPLGGADEAGDFSKAPLEPGKQRVLRLTVEHITSQWNQAQPEIEFLGLRFSKQ
jgi:hypothetical protein